MFLRNERGSTRARNGHCAMTARPRGNFAMAFGEDETFSWASDRLVGPIYCVIKYLEFVLGTTG